MSQKELNKIANTEWKKAEKSKTMRHTPENHVYQMLTSGQNGYSYNMTMTAMEYARKNSLKRMGL